MRHLRLLLNALLAGGLAASYITILFLQVNPAVPLGPALGRLAAVVLPFYGLQVAVACYAVMVLIGAFGGRLAPAWISLRVLAWLAAGAASTGATLMWLNLRGLRLSLAPEDARGMALGALVLTLAAMVFLALALVRHSVRPDRWRLGVALFVVTLAVSLVGPLALRGRGMEIAPPAGSARSEPDATFGTSPTGARVVMLLVDGASLDYVSPAAAEGRLPNFARILDAGAMMHLATLRPTQPESVWTAVATGRLPAANGIRSRSSYAVGRRGPALDLLPEYCLAHALVHFGLLEEVPHTSEALRVARLWDILGASGIASAVIRWPLTHPAPPVHGLLVSERAHLAAGPSRQREEQAATHPAALAGVLHARLDPPGPPATPAPDPAYPAERALLLDRYYAAAFDVALAQPELQVLAIRYQGLDIVAHYFLRQAMPRAFGDVSEDERRQFGRVLEQHYRYVDDELGRALDALGPHDLLLVASPFGMEPVSLPRRLLDRLLGNPPLSGTHERGPDGFLVAYGAHVRAGRLPRASVMDVAPTVLYFLGLPIGRDMDGFARTDVFTPAFTTERPLTFIPTYER